MRRALRGAALGIALMLTVAVLAGCSLFGGADKPKPTPLAPLTPQIAGQQVWSQHRGDVKFPLSVTTTADGAVIATSDGSVLALAAADGRVLWQGSADARLSAGVGSDGRYAAVVSVDNELIVLDAGKPIWRKRLDTLVVTAPLVAGERVFVLGVDRSVQAYDVLDGHKLFEQQHEGDPLTLLQLGVLMPGDNTLVVGLGPHLVGLDPLTGQQRWDVAIASPRGANEVERLADLVGPAARVGSSICARSFQSAVGCVDVSRGALQWTKNTGGTKGVTADDAHVYGADASDRITAWKRDNGEVAWTADGLLYRSLSAPLAVGRTVVFGDFEGQLHFLDGATGKPLLRLPTDGNAIAAAPVLVAGTIIAVTRGGGVYAFRLP